MATHADRTHSAAQTHAALIRRLLRLWHVGGTQGDRVYAALAAMEAENARLRAALREANDRADRERFA